MTNLITIKKDIDKLKQRIFPKAPRYVNIISVFPFKREEPHGKYGGQIARWNLSFYEPNTYRAVSEDRELAIMKGMYDKLPDHCREPNHVWSTFEKYREYHRCTCGNFGHVKEIG